MNIIERAGYAGCSKFAMCLFPCGRGVDFRREGSVLERCLALQNAFLFQERVMARKIGQSKSSCKRAKAPDI